MMHMVVDFTRDVQFIFKTWYAQQDDSPGYLYLGLVLTVIYCFGHMFLPRLEKFIKDTLIKKDCSKMIVKIALTGYQFFYQLSNIIVMMLMMSMNFWVGLAIALGCGLGYSFNGAIKDWNAAVKKHGDYSQISNTSSTLYKKF